ncbi:MAG: Ig-like domain-containing protein [Thermoplasmata archaeon]|nr:MAG: Ig-like domain-containing protein [Thermoplasmata archaeon]
MREKIVGMVLFTFLSIIILLIIVSYEATAGKVWVPEIVDLGSDNSNGVPSMALDSNNYPHLAHNNYGHLEYIHWNGSNWIVETVDTEAMGIRDASIAIDSYNHPHIAYCDGWDNELTYAHWDGISWNIEVVDTDGETSGYCEIALDSLDRPHILFSRSWGHPGLYWVRWTGAEWNFTYAGRGLKPSFTLNSSDYPHYSFYDSQGDDLNYRKWTGSEWEFRIVDSDGDVGLYSSIALDSSGLPHIAYHESDNSDLRYARFDGRYFQIETVDWIDDVGDYCSITLDSMNRPHISYLDFTNHNLKYTRWDGLKWNNETADDGYNVGYYTSIHLDSSDNPHVSYYASIDKLLKHANWTGTQWNVQFVDTGGYTGQYTSLALDSSDLPHISYYDKTHNALKYSNWTGTLWNIETVDSGEDFGQYSSIALDSSDNPHISYFDAENFDLKYAKWTGSNWSTEIVDLIGEVGLYTSIALDSFDHPHISYYSISEGDLKYARWTGISWFIETVDFTGDVGLYTSIAIDSNEFPRICYYDNTKGDLKYANWTGLGWNIETIDSEGDVGRSASITLDSSDNPHISYYNATKWSLKYANWTSSGWTIQTITKWNENGINTTIALDSNDYPHIGLFSRIGTEGEGLRYIYWNGSDWNLENVDFDWDREVGYFPSIALGSDDYVHISYFNNCSYDLMYARQRFNFFPSINIINPPAGDLKVDLCYNISWDDEDIDDNARITLYFDEYGGFLDANQVVSSAIQIQTGYIFEDLDGPGHDNFIWNTVGVPDGSYYIYTIIDDGYNVKIINRSLGTLTIDHRPQVIITSPLNGFFSHDIEICFNLTDKNFSPTDVFINWSVNGIEWFECTEGNGGDGKSGLSSSYPEGVPHLFIWNSDADLPETNITVFINVTPYDPDIGTFDITSFLVDNDNPIPIIITPNNDEHIKGIFNITVTTDQKALSMEFYYYYGNWYFIGFGIYASENDIWYYNWNTTLLNLMDVKIFANATDGVGFRSSNKTGIEIDNTAPTPSVNTPMDDEHILGTYNLTVMSDSDTVSVELFYFNGILKLIGTSSYNPADDIWYFNWDTTDLNLENVAVLVSATDEVGLFGNASKIGIEIDNTAPTPTLLSPLENEHITGIPNLTCISDSDTVFLEFFYCDTSWQSIGIGIFDDITGQWYLNWNTTGMDMVDVLISANATDEVGLLGNTSSSGIEIDNTAPSPIILSPSSNEHISGIYNLTATSDVDTIFVKFQYFDGILHLIGTGVYNPTDDKWYIQWNTSGLDLYNVIVYINATDEVGISGVASSFGIEIDNTPPSPMLVAPTNNEHIKGIYNISATSDSDTVTVEFNYYDGKWNSIGVGIYDPLGGIWYFEWDTNELNLMNIIISANATDEVGLIMSTECTGVEVDNLFPTPQLVSPVNYEHITGIYNLSVICDPDTGSVEFSFYDGSWHQLGFGTYNLEDDKWFLQWDTTDLNLVDVFISVNVTDEVGHSGNTYNIGIEIDNTPPVPILITPVDNEHINGIYNLTATSDVDTQLVEFSYYDGNWSLIGFGTYDSGYGKWYHNWNTTTLDLVNVIISVIATDEVELFNNASSVGIEIDNTAPSPNILTPISNEHITGVHNLIVKSDADTVSINLSYYNGTWQSIGTANYDSDADVWYIMWDTVGLNQKDIIISVSAIDEVAQLGTSTITGLEIDNIPPTPLLLSPIGSEHIKEIYNITATCDLDTISLQFYYYDGNWFLIGNGTYDSIYDKWFYNWNTTDLNLENITLTVNATDEMGHLGTDLNTDIEIDNTPPTPTLLTPSNNQQISKVYRITAESDADTVTLDFNYYNLAWYFIGNAIYDPDNEKWYYDWDTSGLDLTGVILSANSTDEIGFWGNVSNIGIIIDNTGPIITSLTPSNTSINIALDTEILIEFSEPITINNFEDFISFYPTIDIFDYEWNSRNTILTMELSSKLIQNTTYTISINTDVTDLLENSMNSIFISTFTTGIDTDCDDIFDHLDEDDDNDGVPDSDDDFPLDSSESVDTDGDGIGNNADVDDDNDGYNDDNDAHPLDPNLWKSTKKTQASIWYWLSYLLLALVIVCIIIFLLYLRRKREPHGITGEVIVVEPLEDDEDLSYDLISFEVMKDE